MARILTPPAITPLLPRTRPTQHAQAKAARHIASPPVSILGVWRDALAAFGANSAVVLPCALLGFAAPVIAGYWLAAQAALSNYAWVGPIMVLSEKPSAATVVVLTVVWLLGSPFARGVITWGVMCRDDRRSAGAIRMTLARYPALLAGSLSYGAFALACIVCMNQLAPGAQPDAGAGKGKVLPVWAGPSHAWGNATRQLAGRSVSLLTSTSGSPFVEPLFRLISPPSPQANQVTNYEQWLTKTHGDGALSQPQHSGEDRFVAAAGLALLFLAEPLLRFCMVMAFKPSRPRQVPELPGGVGPRRFVAIAALFDGARFGLRHFGVVMRHIWVARIVILTLCLGLVELPLALMDAFILRNAIGLLGKSQLWPLLNFAQVSTAALVSAIILAFSAVYDAQLYAALSKAHASLTSRAATTPS